MVIHNTENKLTWNKNSIYKGLAHKKVNQNSKTNMSIFHEVSHLMAYMSK